MRCGYNDTLAVEDIRKTNLSLIMAALHKIQT